MRTSVEKMIEAVVAGKVPAKVVREALVGEDQSYWPNPVDSAMALGQQPPGIAPNPMAASNSVTLVNVGDLQRASELVTKNPNIGRIKSIDQVGGVLLFHTTAGRNMAAQLLRAAGIAIKQVA